MWLKTNICPEMKNLALEVSKTTTTAASARATTPTSSTSIKKGTMATAAARRSITTSFVGVWMRVALSVV